MNEKRGSSRSKRRMQGGVRSGAQTSPAAQARLALPERIRAVLATRNLTLYEVARQTREKFGGDRRYHIARNFYFQLRTPGFTPTLHHVSALSQISHYSLSDWLAVFGFRLDDISRLQAHLPKARTALLDSALYDPRVAIPCFKERPQPSLFPPIAPLSQLLEPLGLTLQSSLVAPGRDVYLYAKIGRQDALAFPDLLPGSIVRADPRLVAKLSRQAAGNVSNQIFLVEHRRGFCCCRLHRPAKNRVSLVSTQLPFADVEFQLGSEARILGVVDLEFRKLIHPPPSAIPECTFPEVAPDLARLWKPTILDCGAAVERPGPLLRNARLRAALSLREASEMSRAIATALRDPRYFASQASLSDYEVRDAPPRRIHKLLTLCILYSFRFGELLRSFGLRLDGGASIPDKWMPPSVWSPSEEQPRPHEEHTTGFMATVSRHLGGPPFFLHDSLAALSGLPDQPSLNDVFWVGGQQKAMHPALVGALFIVVNRRRRRPFTLRRRSAWEQPPYLLMKRDGSYVLAGCSLENGTIVVHPHAESFVRSYRFRDHVDAEVIGQIVAVVRSILSPT